MKNIIAMWSGPRNISTALMRAFGNRLDTAVLDEPFYAHYLFKTGIDHPNRDAIIDSQSIEWDKIVDTCIGSIPEGRSIWYQKHMAQHNLDGYDIKWIRNLNNCILIRNPKYVIASYNKQYPINDQFCLGYIQQVEIIKYLEKEKGITPPILDANDILQNPRAVLRKLCKKIGISFTDRMLFWSKGEKEYDGVWGSYWYHRVNRSTGFAPYKEKKIDLDKNLIAIYDKCIEHYAMMFDKRIRP